jgi:hypothetical protein
VAVVSPSDGDEFEVDGYEPGELPLASRFERTVPSLRDSPHDGRQERAQQEREGEEVAW